MQKHKLPLSYWLVLAVIVSAGFRQWHLPNKPEPKTSTAAVEEADQPGFKDYVKHPEKLRDFDDYEREIEAKIKEAAKWPDPQVARAVHAFIFDVTTARDADLERRILESLGKRIHPEIVKILGDPAQRKKLLKPTGEDLLPEAPFNRVCDLLGDEPPKDAVAALANFLDDPSEEIRRSAADVLGKIGTIEAVKPLRKALADSAIHVRYYAIAGLAEGANLNALFRTEKKPKPYQPDFAREIYGDVERYFLESDDILGVPTSAQILAHLDPARTKELFLSEKIFTPKFKSLDHALAELANRKIAVPRERLLSLLTLLEADSSDDSKAKAIFETLRLLGQQQHAEDRAALEKRLQASNPTVASGAATGLLAFNQIEDFRERAWQRVEKSGFEKLTSPQKAYLAVTMYDGEVNNGGLSQYFFNSAGDSWKDALAGLETMGFKERLKILQSAVAVFSKTGPSTDREKRQDELAKLARKDDDLFSKLDDRYYACKEDIDVLTITFVLKNIEAFK